MMSSTVPNDVITVPNNTLFLCSAFLTLKALYRGYNDLHLHLGQVADAFIQSDLQ